MFETALLLVFPGQRRGAKGRLAESSVAPVVSGYEPSVRPCEARCSLLLTAIRSEGDRV
jgi:hypothetical protein